MHLSYDGVVARFYLGWRASCKLGHDISSPKLVAAADALQRRPGVTAVDIGSGHTGIYLDVRLNCRLDQVARQVIDLREFAAFNLKV